MMNGKLFLVSVGPGTADLIPARAQEALEQSDAIVGYDLYLTWIQEWIQGKAIHLFPLTQEKDRAVHAIQLARQGQRVSLVSSGDIGVYAMATLAFEMMEEQEPFEVEVIPGITAANACASLLGAPLSHDFATLSLSDLLCPWEWIEERAKRIAQADLAVVLYNVQSRARQDGIYHILKILLEHKSAETWCGIVRNAYRPEQEVHTARLGDLLTKRFDMLTSLVIGNRYTKKRGRFIYTPRGYQGWTPSAPQPAAPSCPQNAFWVFSGTSDGNELAYQIHQRQMPVVVSAATAYGQELLNRLYPGLFQITGQSGMEARRQAMRESRAQGIIDATHPFATEISRQLIALSQELGIPYFRFERPSVESDGSEIFCQTTEDAARIAIERGTRIFLSTGSKLLSVFLNSPGADQKQWFVRLTPDPERIRQVTDLGLPPQNLCAIQGPFSQEFNETLWCQWRIDCVVTKDSGDAGGYTEKRNAAKHLRLPFIVIQRPPMEYPMVLHTVEEVFEQIF